MMESYVYTKRTREDHGILLVGSGCYYVVKGLESFVVSPTRKESLSIYFYSISCGFLSYRKAPLKSSS
jgi:hypothetical protein